MQVGIKVYCKKDLKILNLIKSSTYTARLSSSEIYYSIYDDNEFLTTLDSKEKYNGDYYFYNYLTPLKELRKKKLEKIMLCK